MKAFVISARLLLLATTACLQKVNGASSATPLMIAVRENNLDVLKSLLANGVDAKATNNYGLSALMLAANYGNDNMVKILLPKSDIKATDGYEMSALMYAARFGNKKSVELLLPKSDVKARNNDGQTALDIAKSEGYNQIVELLQEHN